MRYVVGFIDPDTRAVHIRFPEPAGGILKPVERVGEDGVRRTILPFETATPEQLAHHVFWSDGTQERIDRIAREGAEEGSGLAGTLRWLLNLRCRAVLDRTHLIYRVVVLTTRVAWERYNKSGSVT
jgi:hypothetical protein